MNTHTPDSRHDRAPCARLTRRQALRRGFLGATGLLLSDRLAHAAPPVPLKAKAKSVIQVFLWGGMSHTDTWDPKMDAGYDYTGQFKDEIATSVSGIKMGSLFPQLAKQADKYSIIRSMTHRNNGHETAAYLMQTGHLPGERLAYPCIGAIFALLKGYNACYKGLIPPYVVLTQPQGRFSEAGFLGSRCKPFATMNRQCPQLDQGLATLLQDLSERGLLDSTIVWCCGEFGRGPKVDWQPPWNGGRNHFGNVFSVVAVAGK